MHKSFYFFPSLIATTLATTALFAQQLGPSGIQFGGSGGGSSGGSGTITSITCGQGLVCTVNNPITTSGTISFATTAGLSVLGVSGTASAVPGAITGTANQVLGITASGALLAFTQVTNAMLNSASTVVNGVTCTLGSTCSIATGSGAASVSLPGGRLTLTSGSPVMTSDVTGATSIYYHTFAGNQVPVWNGSSMTALTITGDEVTAGFSASLLLSGNVYDVYGVASSGSLALCVAPAWQSTTARGTTAAISLQSGLWTNTTASAHCYGGTSGSTDFGTVSASFGTMLGTIYMTANGQTAMQFTPANTAGGAAPILGVYNQYNQRRVTSRNVDSTAWNYATATWRIFDNNAGNKITFIQGNAQSYIRASVSAVFDDNGSGSSFEPAIGINLDSTSATPSTDVAAFSSTLVSSFFPLALTTNFNPQIGLHYLAPMENALNGNAQRAIVPPTFSIELDM